MKALSKPLSSPSRAEKFPPPLMRFLRSNVASRSRGRSRSSPMFYLRSKKSAVGVIETTQEPSSPKVTCIGQVRVRRSAKSKPNRNRRRCWWLRKTLLCGKISPRLFLRRRKNPLGWMVCKCGSFFGCRKVDTRDCFRVYSNSKSGKGENVDAVNNGDCSSNGSERDYMDKYENLGAGSRENKRGFLEPSSSSSPPKNALILTRCRSAPYRSSSLGGRFWGSPLPQKDDTPGESDQLRPPINVEEEENSTTEMENSAENIQEIKKIGGGAVHPLLLTRCKSEPARIGERLDAEAILLRQIRLADDVVQPRSQQNS